MTREFNQSYLPYSIEHYKIDWIYVLFIASNMSRTLTFPFDHKRIQPELSTIHTASEQSLKINQSGYPRWLGKNYQKAAGALAVSVTCGQSTA